MAAEDWLGDDIYDCFEPDWNDSWRRVAEVVVESKLAWLVRLGWPDEGDPHWFPKSRCRFSDDRTHIFVPGWLAKAKNLQPDNMEPS